MSAAYKKFSMIASSKLKQLMDQAATAAKKAAGGGAQQGRGGGGLFGGDPNMEALLRVRREMDRLRADRTLAPDQLQALLGQLQGRFEHLSQLVNPKAIPLPSAGAGEADAAGKTEPPKPEAAVPAPATPHLPPPSAEPAAGRGERPATPPPRLESPPQSRPGTPMLTPPTTPPPSPPSASREGEAAATAQSVNERFKELSASVGAQLDRTERRKLGRVLNKIRGTQQTLTTSRKGEVVFKKRAIPGSDFGDLVRFAFAGKRPRSSQGLQEFLQGLVDLGFEPKDVAGKEAALRLSKLRFRKSPIAAHTRRRSDERKRKRRKPGAGAAADGDEGDDEWADAEDGGDQGGSGARHPPRKGPPGQRPHILELYKR